MTLFLFFLAKLKIFPTAPECWSLGFAFFIGPVWFLVRDFGMESEVWDLSASSPTQSHEFKVGVFLPPSYTDQPLQLSLRTGTRVS